MKAEHCTLCELETPDPPITDPDIDGVFCCSGCLHVYKLLQNMEGEQAEQLRKQTIQKRHNEQKETTLPEDYEEAFFKVNGMHCSTCESFVEALADREDSIYKSEASYASEMIKVYYDPKSITPDTLPDKLSKLGYKVRPIESSAKEEQLNEVARIIIGGFFGIIGLLLYVLFLYPSYLGGGGIVPLTENEKLFFVSNIFVMTTFVLLYTGFPILRGAWVSLSVLKPNMDLLITIAAVSAYLYSVGAMLIGSSEVYFDVTMAIVLVVSIGNYYEKKIKSGKHNLLAKLTEKRIQYARLLQNGKTKETAIENLNPGDQVLVKAGERIPIDGTVIDGRGVVNEALMTGESIPVSKDVGDSVLSGTILTQNALTIEIGDSVESTIDNLMQMMWNIQSARPGQQRLADRIATWFVPSVILLGIVTFVYHMMSGAGATESMLSSLAVLIVSCPCALGLATPLAIASGIRSGLEHEIIFKTAAVFEEQMDTATAAFDKTGTLTTGTMQLLDNGNNEQALRYAAQLEQYASHPIAEPIAAYATNKNTVDDFTSYSTGISGQINGMQIFVGQPEWINNHLQITEKQWEKINSGRNEGNVPVAVGWDNRVRSILTVGDQIRDEAPKIVKKLQSEGKKVAIITGDSKQAGDAIRRKLNPDFLFTETRPDSKSNIVEELRKFGRIAMIGDGSNDAPALAQADLGIAFGNLTAIAADSAHVIIPREQLGLIPAAFNAIKLTKKRIRQNLGWAFLYNIITIPLAIAGAINPLFAAVAMATSSLLVVGNSSRDMQLISE
ncbi:heavy metal translocating P-type ATPase [Aliifodinibius salipaludis]|uniref:Heavy metal translocating P-type ATPase n=1 Tax=Fodinibius salipaludis TaxID=2032627 RepID=A0A2A2G8Q9_9BACT|nr:cation-translocating P-type ATPase [Aliifodinibius salipaludis]PAU94136.1 heavy metal translocating P-type ATPase [Aliifodinibius salipaludis]